MNFKIAPNIPNNIKENNMGLKQYDYEKLLDDIKLISRSVAIILDENNPVNRKRAGQLTEDLITRLFRDIEEMVDGRTKKDSFGGYLTKDGIVKED